VAASARTPVPPAVLVWACAAAVLVASALIGNGVDAASRDREELVGQRTATSKTFRNSNGSLTTALYADPVHYRAHDGSYRPIDSRLVRRSGGVESIEGVGDSSGYAYRNAANGFDLRFKDRLTEDFMQFGAGGERFSLTMLGAAARPAETTAGGIEFAGVKPAADLRYDISATGAKESLVLRGSRASSRYRFLLETEADPRAVTPRQESDGSWQFFVGSRAVPAFVLGRPAASEFKSAPEGATDPVLTAPMGADNVELDVRRVRGGFVVELEVDRRWLRSAERRFPVVVDPTISFQPGDSNSLTMEGDCPLCWVWEGEYIEVGAKTDSVLRGAIKFDVGQIPPTATISNATMRLESGPHDCIATPSTNWADDCDLVGHQVDLHRMTAYWDGHVQTEDIQFESTPEQSFTIPVGSTTTEAWSPEFDVTGDVADWVAGTDANHGWLLKRSSEAYGASGPIFMGTIYKGPQHREPSLEITYSTDGVQLHKPTTLHSDGAELSWSRFDGSTGNAFSKYEVHRSEAAGFTPSESTRLTTISDPGVTQFRDTTAAPNRAFSYKVVTNGQRSIEQRVTLPVDGQGKITYQGAQAEGTSTYIQDLGLGTGCENFGVSDRLVIGGRNDYTGESAARGLLAYDLHDIPAGATINNATLNLSIGEGEPTVNTTVNLHRATRAWKEGSGYHGEGDGFYTPLCTGDGASWKHSDGTTLWTGAGGDYDATVVDSETHPANEQSDANFDVAPIVRDWVDGDAPNFGFVLKASDETNPANGMYYASDDYPANPADRPTLTVNYADGSDSQGPDVAIGKPGPGDVVQGTVTVEATAIDDRRVDSTELLVDGVVKASDGSAPYSYSWNSTTAANGSRNLTVRATDDVGNQTTSAAVSVNVSNSAPPTTAITFPSSMYQNQVKGHAPAAYWRLGETTGTTAADFSGNNKNGTYADAYTLGLTGLVNGNTDKAAQLRTGNKQGKVTVTGLTSQLATKVTAEALVTWAAPASNNTYNRVLARNWGSAGGWLLAVRKDGAGVSQAYFAVNKAGVVTEVKSAVTPGRMHIAGTYDTATLRLFVNGLEVATAPLATAALNTSASVIAGATIASNTTVDEAAVYGTNLSAAELKSHWEVANQRDPTIGGLSKVTANASDDGTLDKVEFYVDGNMFGSDATGPYEATLDTQSTAMPIYDGAHVLTTKAYDNHGQVTESSPFTVVADNAGKSRYIATLSSTAVPAAVDYEPGAGSQQQHGLDVTVTNKSTETWSATDIVLRYRWFSPDPPPDGPTITNGPEVALGSALAPNASTTKTVMVEPPQLPDGVDKAQYRLQVDLYEKSATRWFADRGSKPVENPVIVNKTLLTALGLERWLHYDGESLGAGMTHLLNVANGNSIVRWSPFSAPGRGLSTNVDLTYNALEKKSESPVGNNFSLSISSLSRFGNPIDIHPNKADEIAGRANRFVEFTDGDGSTHRFIGKQHADGTVYWEEPDGVHLFLWNPGGGDPARKWAFTRPDDTTFFYDIDGYPTSVEDRNGNKVTFTLEDTPPGEDPGGPKKRITKVTDAAGQGANPQPNRSFDISYYSKQNAKSPHVRGKISRITDHSGSALDFEYYRDGNLLRLTQRGGGTQSDGSALRDRGFVFTYTDSPGNAPAIPQEADRRNPDSTTSNQSTRLYSVRQPRALPNTPEKEETIFTYLGSGNGVDRWKLASRKDRTGATNSYSYDTTNKKTTVALPEGVAGQSRTSRFYYDNQGKVTKINDPKGEDTLVEWTADRHVQKVTFQPTGRFTSYEYNTNGYLTKETTLGRLEPNLREETTRLYYQHRPVAVQDQPSYWKPGRPSDEKHLSLLSRVETPRGVATTSPTDDFDWNFTYDDAGNLLTAADPKNKTTTYAYVQSGNGDLESITDARGHRTFFASYDANGLSTRIEEADGTSDERATEFTYTDDGLLEWLEDPNHVDRFDQLPDEERRTHFVYDAFHRLARQTTPLSTERAQGTPEARGKLIVSSAVYDANDNLMSAVDPSYTREQLDPVRTTTTDYDAMDRPKVVTEKDTEAATADETTTIDYDLAGRTTKVKLPLGQGGGGNVHATEYSYDALDRPTRESRHRYEGGTFAETLHEHFCYDGARDLEAVVHPKEGVATVNCATVGALNHVTEFDYDAAHRLTKATDGEGRSTQQVYDENGNVDLRTDPAGKETDFVYDERDMVTEVVQDAGLPSQADVTTAYRYDEVGNLDQLVSPRAFEIHGPRDDYADLEYVEEYTYDALDRLTRTAFPRHSAEGQPDHMPATYQHRAYDDNGNVTLVSLPSDKSSLGDVALEDKTEMKYFDPGWVARSDDHVVSPVAYEYTAKGQQATQAPEGTTRERIWRYFADGPVREERDFRRNGVDGVVTYGYDLNDNLRTVSDTTGLTQTTQTKRVDVTADYDGLDRLKESTDREGGGTPWTATTYDWDPNGNLRERIDDVDASESGLDNTTGRRHLFTHDRGDRLDTHTDHGEQRTAASDDRLITTTWTPTGLLDVRRIRKWDGSGFGDHKQMTDRDWSENGLLTSLKTYKSDGAGGDSDLRESHALTYTDSNGVYLNGHKTKDIFRLKGPNDDCTASDCTATFLYDARDRLVEEHRGHGTTPGRRYTLSPSGNVEYERHLNSDDNVVRTERSHYDGSKLAMQEVVGSTIKSWYFYDCFGNLDVVRTQAHQAARESCSVKPENGEVVADYKYDDFDRLERYEFRAGTGSVKDATDYVYDALDRPREQRETHTASEADQSRRVEFDYVGLTSDVAEERHFKPETDAGDLKRTKSYSYDALGNRVGMTDARTGKPAKDYGYSQDPQGSISLLLDDAGEAKAAYGYFAYGEADGGLTKELNPYAAEPNEPATSPGREPFNAYRFMGKRLDTGSGTPTDQDGTHVAGQGTLDMGARRFGPDAGRFLQRDTYASALGDLSLSTDPLTQNRYALSGGNPISFVEVDGHIQTDANTNGTRWGYGSATRGGSGGGSGGGGGGAPRVASVAGKSDAATGGPDRSVPQGAAGPAPLPGQHERCRGGVDNVCVGGYSDEKRGDGGTVGDVLRGLATAYVAGNCGATANVFDFCDEATSSATGGAAAGVAGLFGGGKVKGAVGGVKSLARRVLGLGDEAAPGAAQAIRNKHLAGRAHPKTGVPFDKQGYPNFSAWRHPDVPDVRIALSGTRATDFARANKAAGLPETPSGFTWHHHQDAGLMQLVETRVHRATGHTGGFSGG
jgi:YD repeat-containing protein